MGGKTSHSVIPQNDLENTCLALLNGEPVKVSESQARPLLAFAQEQGIAPLLHEQLNRSPPANGIPQELLTGLQSTAIHEAAAELARRHELEQVLSAFAKASIKPILTKGTPLAYTLYPNPNLRPRCDTDLLIPLADKDRAINLLIQLGYRFPNTTSGRFVMHQAACTKQPGSGLPIQLDIHWRISNRPSFARILAYERLIKNAIAVPGLGPHACTPDNKEALLYACLHRAGHILEGMGNRLIWLYDIHLLIGAQTEAGLADVVEEAGRNAVSALCLDAFEQTRKRFQTRIPETVMHRLREDSKKKEITGGYLDQSWQASILSDLRSLPGLPNKLTLLREHLFPPREYMLRKYRTDKRLLLPVLYLHRLVSGFRKRLR